MRTPRAILLLALSTVVVAALLPPEAYPAGRTAAVVAASFVLLAGMSRNLFPARAVIGGLTVFLLLLVHSLFVSVDAYRSLEFLTVLWAYFCLFLFFSHVERETDTWTIGTIVAVAGVVAGYGLYQYFFGFEQLYSYVAYSGSTEIQKVPVLDRIATKRVFSTLALPGTLWGFLMTALPLHLALRKNSRLLDAALAVSAVAIVATCILTRSFGFLAATLVLAAGAVALWRRQWLRVRTLLPLLLMLILGGAAFYAARRESIVAANPASLRFMNWLSAWTVFAEYPWGSGLNGFGVVYPQYAIPGANETQFTHNTPLQLLSELGWPGLLFLAAIAVWLASKPRFGLTREPGAGLILAAAVWTFHNLIDINVYFPSVGIIGAVLLGLLFKRDAETPASASPKLLACAGLVVAAVTVFSGLGLISAELQHRAQIEFDEGRTMNARATLESARRIMPFNSSLFHDSGDLLLYMFHKTHKPEMLAEATAAFQRAIELSPLKVGPHLGYGLCLSSAGRIDEALVEVRRAHELFPNGTNAESVVRLMEKTRDERASSTRTP